MIAAFLIAGAFFSGIYWQQLSGLQWRYMKWRMGPEFEVPRETRVGDAAPLGLSALPIGPELAAALGWDLAATRVLRHDVAYDLEHPGGGSCTVWIGLLENPAHWNPRFIAARAASGSFTVLASSEWTREMPCLPTTHIGFLKSRFHPNGLMAYGCDSVSMSFSSGRITLCRIGATCLEEAWDCTTYSSSSSMVAYASFSVEFSLEGLLRGTANEIVELRHCETAHGTKSQEWIRYAWQESTRRYVAAETRGKCEDEEE